MPGPGSEYSGKRVRHGGARNAPFPPLLHVPSNGATPHLDEPHERPSVNGKFLFVGDRKLYVRGVTYGTFRDDVPAEHVAARDFAAMVAAGVNSVRLYTVPPRWLLDLAAAHGLRVLVGVPWEQHVAFLDSRARRNSIEARVREGVAACAGHPAVLGYAVGNEIPAPIARWHGRRAIEGFVERLYEAAKDEDPGGLVTYVNYPSTEYLRLDFLDLACFNVYLESPESHSAYLARLQNLAGERPLLMAEIGLDSRRNGLDAQAESLRWQVESAFTAGCAGAFVFSWTDEWHRGGVEIKDWDFGLTDRRRRPKPALDAVSEAFRGVPLREPHWPRASVVVASYNGEPTLADCLRGLAALDYPDYEVIVVDDGSTDSTAAIAERFGVRLIRTRNRGLAAARNTGWQAASGSVVAYIDDDAWPDPQWLKYMVVALMRSDHAGVGGPNLHPPGSGRFADCVANSPGGPIHVLVSDTEAEHIPGCNMAYRRAALEAVGGFDPQFRVAGDDVDVCWQLQQAGFTLGFAPAGVVWHRRRGTLRTYWRQQRGYGRAEALLERKWPEKYNSLGHARWSGRLYGRGLPAEIGLRRRWRVYYGVWGSGAFQSSVDARAGLRAMQVMPEWFLVLALLCVASVGGLVWSPLEYALPFAGAVAALLLARAAAGGAAASFPGVRSRFELLRLRTVTALLHLIQPLGRLTGRVVHGLHPWRRRHAGELVMPRPRSLELWYETWRSHGARLALVEDALGVAGATAAHGSEFDRWELEVQGGSLGSARLRTAIEEHGEGRQLLRCLIWPRFTRAAWRPLVAGVVAGAVLGASGAWTAAACAFIAAALVFELVALQCASACAYMLRAVEAADANARQAGDVVAAQQVRHACEAREVPAALAKRNGHQSARELERDAVRMKVAE